MKFGILNDERNIFPCLVYPKGYLNETWDSNTGTGPHMI